jgi:HEPN domain-containing protein
MSSTRSCAAAVDRKAIPEREPAEAIIGFHAQQAAEKLIKAVLVARGVAFI